MTLVSSVTVDELLKNRREELHQRGRLRLGQRRKADHLAHHLHARHQRQHEGGALRRVIPSQGGGERPVVVPFSICSRPISAARRLDAEWSMIRKPSSGVRAGLRLI